MKRLSITTFILTIFSFSCFSQQEIPSCIPATLVQSYQAACKQRTKDAQTVYFNSLASLQQECIARSDFSNAIIVKKALEQAQNNATTSQKPSSAAWESMIEVVLKSPSNWTQKLTPEGKFIQMSPSDKEYRTTPDAVDIERSMPDAIIFNSILRRKWLLLQEGGVVQIFHNDTHVEKLSPLQKGDTPPGNNINDKLIAAQQQYHTACARATAPITAKFIPALDKIQKKALADGKLDDCILIKKYIDSLQSASGLPTTSPACLKGGWTNTSNTHDYDFNESGAMIVRTKSGKIEQQGKYVRSSPAGNYFFFKITEGTDKGEEHIVFPYDGKIFLLKGDYSNWIRVLSPRAQ